MQAGSAAGLKDCAGAQAPAKLWPRELSHLPARQKTPKVISQ